MAEQNPVDDAQVQAADVAFGIQELHTRLLLPFSISRRSVNRIAEELLELKYKDRSVWQRFDSSNVPIQYYTMEAQPAALRQLFGPPGEGKYLKISDETANSLFGRKLVLTTRDGRHVLPLRFVHSVCGEMFLSEFGVGILSLTLRLDEGELAARQPAEQIRIADAERFNNALSHLQQWVAPSIRVVHPRDDEAGWNAIPENRRAAIPDPPAADAGLLDRLAAPGGEYQLAELIELLLSPCASEREFARRSDHLIVYTVARFGDAANFAQDETQRQLSRVLSSLAQVEEPAHAGAIPGAPGVEHAILNQNHWAGVGCLAAAHLIADQPGDVAFNRERLPRVRDRYFSAYVTALLQLMALERTSEIVGNSMQDAALPDFDACAPEFRRVLRDMIQFNTVAYLPSVSHREVLNRYYHLSQKGTQVDRAWARVNQNIASLDAACRTSQQEGLAREQAHDLQVARETLQESRVLHAKVEWVEVFIVGVYAAELVHLAGESFPFDHVFVGWFTLGSSLLAALTAFLLLRPDHHAKIPHLGKACLGALAVLAIYLWLGFSRFENHQPHHPPHEEKQESEAAAETHEKGSEKKGAQEH